MTQDLGEKIDKVLKENITLHSIRQGYGVFSITSFETIRDQILALIKEAGYKSPTEVQELRCESREWGILQ